MSEEEEFNTVIQEIKEIYLLLTQGEPSPDDEIEARTTLIEKIAHLKELNAFQVEANMRLFEETLTKLETWDTLDLWFTESELPGDIKKIINITEEIPIIEEKEERKEEFRKQAQSDLDSVKIDINEIVDQVSDKFKGEIDNLKQKIDFLQHEIEVKDEALKQTTPKRIVKKITPKKDVKLPPPKIKIPPIKKPDVIPQVKAPNKIEVEKRKETVGVKSIEDVQAKIEKEIEKIRPTPPFEEKPKIYEEMHEEAKSVLNILEELEPSPDITPLEISIDSTKEFASILDILDEQETVPKVIEEKGIEHKTEESKKIPIVTEASLVEEESEKQKVVTPFIPKKPKITTVSVEEIETEEIKSSGKELFDVFSSVGNKTVETISTTVELTSLEPIKEKKKKEAKKKKKESDAIDFVDFSVDEPEIDSKEEITSNSFEELPKDKDLLYQELIALEGRRYSLEKNFKEIEKSYNMGSIDDFEYKNRNDDLSSKLEEITSRINRIRRIIASM
ncbi:MAG: hypothetical protein ACFE94_19070 [Candidatus Hodarchaeota archaeon]